MTDGLPAPALLSAWEAGAASDPVERALALMRAPDAEGWPVGRRDAALLDRYAATFGEQISATTTCRGCGDQLEVALDVADLRQAHVATGDELELVADGDLLVRFRLPTSADLRVAAAAATTDVARRRLAERCVVGLERAGMPLPPALLPDEVVAELGAVIARQDPQSDVRLDLTCGGCGYRWVVRFDIADYLWRRVTAEARRLLADVHTLAAVYGWSEADILALSDQRRERYLDLVLG